MLEQVDLGLSLNKTDYQTQLPPLQNRLHEIQQACWAAGLASLVVFEGWTFSGKGSMIQKLTQKLEPRGFDLFTTVGPRSQEMAMPWLWRFWNKIPDYGRIAIFDRSWYRRVLTERVGALVEPEQWRSGYADINTFEQSLSLDRYEVVKFFLHIDKEVQRARLDKWKAEGLDTWQVSSGSSDHEKYDAYFEATEDMLERTETEWAPWFIIEATDKRWARVKIFQTAIKRLEAGLRNRGHEVPAPLDLSHSDDADLAGLDD